MSGSKQQANITEKNKKKMQVEIKHPQSFTRVSKLPDFLIFGAFFTDYREKIQLIP